MTSPSPLHTLWGRADDGALVRISVPADTAESESTPHIWWPPIGLERLPHAPEAGHEPDLTLAADPTDPNTWDRLESDLGLFTAERLATLVAVHAAVLVRDSTMILVPGVSMVGKTTLCAAALEAGIEVWSDEYALVDPDTGLVRGWPRRLRVRTPDGGATRIPIGTTGESADPLIPSLVASVRYSGAPLDDTALDVATAHEGDVVFALLANTVCGQSRPNIAFRAALSIASRCAGVQGRRGDAATALRSLFALTR